MFAAGDGAGWESAGDAIGLDGDATGVAGVCATE
jgi:hypothetical protein